MKRTEIGGAINRRRHALGLTQVSLAKQAGVSQPYLSQLEAGTRKRISFTILRHVADALGLTPLGLLEQEAHAMPRHGRTEFWLYQMRQRPDWGPLGHLSEVREGRLLAGHRDESESKLYRLGGRPPQSGDMIALFWAPTDADTPGLCGFGVITEFGAERRLRFRALPPTNALQRHPQWTPRVRNLVQQARPVAEGTMWQLTDAKHIRWLLAEIFAELDGSWLRDWAAGGTNLGVARRLTRAAQR